MLVHVVYSVGYVLFHLCFGYKDFAFSVEYLPTIAVMYEAMMGVASCHVCELMMGVVIGINPFATPLHNVIKLNVLTLL